jgi:osmotically-inducible protein OsmY
MPGTTPYRIHPTDVDIGAAARRALDDRGRIASTVRVHVDNGVAILTGSVRLASERAEAEDTVRRVRDVKQVVNNVSVTVESTTAATKP